MKPLEVGQDIRKHPWLFAGVCVIPSLLPLANVISGLVRGSLVTDFQIPMWLGILAFPLWPIIVGLTGLLLFLCLASVSDSSRFTNPRTKAYLILFVIAWNLVFGYGDLIAFGLGLDHAYGEDVFVRSFISVLTGYFPSCVLFSLAICSGLVAVVVACVELIVWILHKANPKPKNIDNQS